MSTPEQDHGLRVIHGTLIHAPTPSSIDILPSTLIVISSTTGTILHLVPSTPSSSAKQALEACLDPASSLAAAAAAPPPRITFLPQTAFLIPGFIDTHNHAPQWLQRGLGQGMHILDWLSGITFPNESRYADPAHAKQSHALLVRGMLRQGVTTACYYSSLHGPATNLLADQCLAMGQRALVGKCNMDRDSPDFYREVSAQQSLRDTESCVAHIRRIDPLGRHIRPVLTPRFAISCTEELLSGLGEIARREEEKQQEQVQQPNGSPAGIAIQTHFCEAQQEIDYTLSLFPQFTNEADLYAHYGLLTHRSILAHCTMVSAYELDRLEAEDCGIAHCPTANMTVGGGFMAAPVRDFLDRGIKVGLGTDSGGGFSSSMLDAMRHALIASFAREGLYDNATLRKQVGDVTTDAAIAAADQTTRAAGAEKKSVEGAGLRIEDVFHAATMGGARVIGRDDELGSFAPGKQFDALVVDMAEGVRGVNTPLQAGDDPRTVFDKFIMTGDDRNIREVYVAGAKVHP